MNLEVNPPPNYTRNEIPSTTRHCPKITHDIPGELAYPLANVNSNCSKLTMSGKNRWIDGGSEGWVTNTV